MGTGRDSAYVNARAMLSVFGGSRLADGGLIPGGGLAGGLGLYGRNAGFIMDTHIWVNEPIAFDYVPESDLVFSFSLMARFRVDL